MSETYDVNINRAQELEIENIQLKSEKLQRNHQQLRESQASINQQQQDLVEDIVEANDLDVDPANVAISQENGKYVLEVVNSDDE